MEVVLQTFMFLYFQKREPLPHSTLLVIICKTTMFLVVYLNLVMALKK